MRTLHLGLRVADLDESLTFYRVLGYEVVGSVPETSLGHLTMLKLPDDEFVTIELVYDSSGTDIRAGENLSHLVIKVESLDDTRSELAARGIQLDDERPQPPSEADEVRTSWITDPDGNRIELVQWPSGHADGMSAADFRA
jgi:lactoylglutathione lyase